MKKKQKPAPALEALLVVLIIALVGGSAYWLYKEKLQAPDDDAPSDPQPSQARATPAPQAPQLPAGNRPPVEEVNNAFFQRNPHAYAAIDTNIRDYPGQAGNVIKTAKAGEYLGRHTGKSSNVGWPSSPGTWAKVTITNGRVGWIFSGNITSKTTAPGGTAPGGLAPGSAARLNGIITIA